MKSLLVLLLGVAVQAGPADWRVVGGSNAVKGEYPYQVSLRKSGQHSCGGSILNSNTILTAAHCVYLDFNPKTIVTGSVKLYEGGDVHAVDTYFIHDGYNSLSTRNDIAIIKVETEIVFNDFVQPLSLQTGNVQGGVKCVLTGWGYTQYPGTASNDLQKLALVTLSNEECTDQMSQNNIYEGNICTFTQKGEGACKGDSGGPLVCDGKQVGIVSWGKACALGYPDVFTRVSSYIDWIQPYFEK